MLLAATLAGCGAEVEDAAPAGVTAAPTTTEAEPGLRGALLTAEELPGLNDEFTWEVESTRTREPRQPFGTCHEFGITSVGATDVAVRTYRPARGSGPSAAQLVAEFPDEKTAERAYAVLRSWAEDCADQLTAYRDVQVGRVQPVEVPTGEAAWQLLIYGPAEGEREAGHFDAQGFTRVGARISMLEMRSVGQDYNYPRGQEPVAVTVEVAAALLTG